MKIRAPLLRFLMLAAALVALAVPQASAAAPSATLLAMAGATMPAHHMPGMAHGSTQADLDLCTQHCLASVAVLPATPAPVARPVGRPLPLPASPAYLRLDPPEPQGPPPKPAFS